MMSSLKRPSENDSAEYRKRVRILHEDLPQSARVLKRSIEVIPQIHESLKAALDKVIAGDPLSENLLKVLDVSINLPDEVTDPGLGFLVQGANEERQALVKLYRSALESSTHQQTDALVRDRNKAVEDGRKARNPSEGAAHPQIMSEQKKISNENRSSV
ncbi:hypothetical protein M407DRAFT_181817 [Tulasnella calospora MUT 4182]|uniref:Uncharacterized protein n=1 Tax=Tulasnella calospora MUT 4182 TaxID=1051891 RepID=A0A0C3QLC7_9AGAM|nr:hypothetical protein M407DRAFT_181817 [Tulasnella calospora MUT 4182]